MNKQKIFDIKNETVKKTLSEVINTNSRFIPHLKDNLIKISEEEIYYLGQQGWSTYNNNSEPVAFHQGKNNQTFQEERIYRDWIENIKSDHSSLSLETNRLREEKLNLLGIRFSKRLDNILIQQTCQESNFNPSVITKTKEINLKDFFAWVITNTSQMINTVNPNYSKESQGHGNLVIDAKDLILLINQPLADEARLKRIFKEIDFTDYLKDLIIIDHPLPNNFQGVLINKKALWYNYQIKSIQQIQDETTRLNLTISYELGLLPFVGACAYLKS